MYWLTGILGIGLVAAPFVAGCADVQGVVWSNTVLGGLALLLSVYQGVTRRETPWIYWLCGLLGLAAVLSPLLLGYASRSAALWASFVPGVVLMVCMCSYQAFVGGRGEQSAQRERFA